MIISNLDDYLYKIMASEGDDSVNNGMKSESSPDGDLIRESVSSSSKEDHSIYEQISITNCLLVGIILFIGVFFGAFCMSHLFSRIRKE